MAVASDGTVYGTYSSSQVVGWVTSSASWQASTLPAPPNRPGWIPGDIAVDRRNGDVLVSDWDAEKVDVYRNGVFLSTPITLLKNVGAVAVDSAGNIYVLEYETIGKLRKYDSSGSLLRTYGGALSFPSGVAVGAEGVVWVTEEEGRAWKIACM